MQHWATHTLPREGKEGGRKVLGTQGEYLCDELLLRQVYTEWVLPSQTAH